MKHLKFTFLVAVAALASFMATPARAQYTVWATNMTRINGGTNEIRLTTNSSYTTQGIIDAKFSEFVAIGFQYTFHAAPIGVTPTVIARFQRSVDYNGGQNSNGNWETAVPISITCSGATNAVLWVTNVPMQGFRALRLSAIENTNSTPLTNLFLYYGIKR